MIYEVRTSSGYTFITVATELLSTNGVYYGSSNLIVRGSVDYSTSTGNTYVLPGTRTVYYNTGSGSTQYHTIVSVTPRYDLYYTSGVTEGGFGLAGLILMGVIVICSLFRTFFRH